MIVLPSLRWLASSVEGRAWLEAMPAIVADVAERWGLDLGEPFAGSSVSWVAPAGADLVLKVQFPDAESEHEALALRYWRGEAAVRLVDHDPALRALLLERCWPGSPLSEMGGVVAVELMTGILPRLWVPLMGDEPFGSLADEAARWASTIRGTWNSAGRPCEERLVDAAAAWSRDLGPTLGERVLVHQDLHGDNVLAASREPWLVIDPKPLAGEREFSVAPIVRSAELGHTRAAVRYRLDRLTGELGLDRERARGWTIAQTMAWSFGSPIGESHHQVARWLLE